MKKIFVLVIDCKTWVLTIESEQEVTVQDYDINSLIAGFARNYNLVGGYGLSRDEYIARNVCDAYNKDNKYFATLNSPDGILHY